jgi:hypothetical protein
MEPNRIKEILKKIDSEGPDPLMPVLNKYEPLKVEAEMKKEEPPVPVKISKWRIYAAAMVAFLILVGVGYGLTLVYSNFKLIRSDDPAAVVAALSKVADLPAGETPTVSTITDLESIKDQPFFRDAELGDKVVVFNNAKKAYIYRPTTQKLVVIAPLSQ